MLSSLLRHRHLIRELVSRDIRSRYVGSVAGLFWSILNPALQLALYTLVFSLVPGASVRNRGLHRGLRAEPFRGPAPLDGHSGECRSLRPDLHRERHHHQEAAISLEALPFSVLISAFVHQLLGTAVFLVVLAVTQLTDFRFLILIFPSSRSRSS